MIFNYILNTLNYSLNIHNMERETGLKPATSALARRRSINWAIPASSVCDMNNNNKKNNKSQWLIIIFFIFLYKY